MKFKVGDKLELGQRVSILLPISPFQKIRGTIIEILKDNPGEIGCFYHITHLRVKVDYRYSGKCNKIDTILVPFHWCKRLVKKAKKA